MPNIRVLLLIIIILMISIQTNGAPLTTAFTYQGNLNDSGVGANGSYDFQFQLYDAITLGSQIGLTVLLDDIAVIDGIFSVAIDFGDAPFIGDDRWCSRRC
ncbi:MAG: hypothetical protein JKY19_00685 [Alcanivoracaceae bacterium]|nr:hypothetical protein [Alcanivoracaceae bacterium]